jgi:hypothetical protein
MKDWLSLNLRRTFLASCDGHGGRFDVRGHLAASKRFPRGFNIGVIFLTVHAFITVIFRTPMSSIVVIIIMPSSPTVAVRHRGRATLPWYLFGKQKMGVTEPTCTTPMFRRFQAKTRHLRIFVFIV